MARTVLEVFLSSTAADLGPYREAVHRRLSRIEFFRCIRQEDFGAQDAEAMRYCCDKAQSADLFIGLIGLRRGWEPREDAPKRSITELEYDAAKVTGRRRFLWLSPDDFSVPGNLHENATLHKRQLAFRKRVMAEGERIVSQKGFASPDVLASEIAEQLLAYVVSSDLIKLLRPDLLQSNTAAVEEQIPIIAAAVEKLADDKDVDLLALAANPRGVNLTKLESMLEARASAHEANARRELQSSAEYWRHIGALAFLRNTKKALSAYTKATTLDPNDVDGWRCLGELQYRVGELTTAKATFSTLAALGKETGDKRAESIGTLRIGWIHESLGELTDAARAMNLALELARAINWPEGMARAYSNLGLIHEIERDFSKAEEMLNKALMLEEQVGNTEGMARCYSNLGLVHKQQGELDRADQMQRKALLLCEQAGNTEGVAHAYGNLGSTLFMRGDFDNARKMQRKALKLFEELEHEAGTSEARTSLDAIRAAVRARQRRRKSNATSNVVG